MEKNAFVFLQETHSLVSDENQWQTEWGSDIIFSHGSNNSRGVAILFPGEHDCRIEHT